MSLRIEALSRHAVARRVLDRVSLQLGAGEFLALLGPAGSGRRALLRMLAGLEEPDAGRILLDGRDVTRLPPGRRGVGCLFRHDPLFGHPTVFDAVAAALPGEGGGLGPSDAAATGARVRHLLGLVGLAEDGGRMPAMLPPGKRHRLALARALAAEPRLLGVGEGFGLADPGRRSTPPPRRWLLDLHRRLGLTTILIAHGPGEALALGDRVAVLNAGRVEQVGTPAELRRRPASAFVAGMLGGAGAAPDPWDEAMPGAAPDPWDEAMPGAAPDPWDEAMPSAAPNSWGEAIWGEAMPGAAPGGWPEGRPPGHVPSPGPLQVVEAGSGREHAKSWGVGPRSGRSRARGMTRAAPKLV
jgi:ABC-type sulfate/molybdate transport systems ATPase subunit